MGWEFFYFTVKVYIVSLQCKYGPLLCNSDKGWELRLTRGLIRGVRFIVMNQSKKIHVFSKK